MLNKKKIVLLDLCSISTIKTGIKGDFKGDKTKEKNFNDLKEMISSKEYRFSFFLAITERCSYSKKESNIDELIKQFQEDYKSLLEIINKENIVENEPLIGLMVNELLNNNFSLNDRLEQGFHHGVELIEYLNSVVKQQGGNIKKENRENLVNSLFEKANELNFTTKNFVFITCVAAIYGCKQAQAILKLSSKKFNATNSASDIYLILRAENVFSKLNFYNIDLPVLYHTADKNLNEYYTFFQVESRSINERVSENTIHILEKEKIFPAIFSESSNNCQNNEQFKKLNERIHNN